MSSLSTLLHVGASGLYAYQQSLSVTSHNIANLHTKGYSRQEAVLAENRPQDGRPGQLGTGVHVEQVRRSLDRFLNDQLLSSQEQLGQFAASKEALTETERIFGDANNAGLGLALGQLFDAFQDVATQPSDLAARAVVLAKAQRVVDRFRGDDQALRDQRQALDRQAGQAITDVNRFAGDIAALTAAIRTAETSGQQANDLRDQRERLLHQLGELIDVSAAEDATGRLTVFVGKGQVLIDGERVWPVSGVPNGSNAGLLDVQQNQGGSSVVLSGAIAGGRLKGLLHARDQIIPNLRQQLDTLAAAVVGEVNGQHQLGYGLDGSTGVTFFSGAGTTAATISLALTDGKRIAASDSAAGVPGNNVNALALSTLQHKVVAALGNTTLNGYYEAAAAGLGALSQKAAQDLDTRSLLHQQLEGHWAEVSGVSLDEELVNMIKYQRAFQASSKVITMADELFQTILSLKR